MAKILYIENDKTNIEVMKSLLWEYDLKVVNSIEDYNNKDRVKIYDTLFISERVCSKGELHEFVTELRDIYSMWELPIVIIGSYFTNEEIISHVGVGINDYMTLPLNYKLLTTKIQFLENLKSNHSIERNAKSLLYNIIPKDVVKSICRGNSLITKYHKHITVLFSDIVNYTVISSTWSPERVIKMLDQLFCAFDVICEKYGVYKVETIGDAYMIVTGIDNVTPLPFQTEIMTKVAEEMLDAASSLSVQIRIGMHCGSAHSGVIGLVRPRYSFFGDTVNTASRMESTGYKMCVQVSKSFYENIECKNNVIELGKREIKGKGLMDTYLLKVGDWQRVYMSAKHLNNSMQRSRSNIF